MKWIPIIVPIVLGLWEIYKSIVKQDPFSQRSYNLVGLKKFMNW